MSDAAWFTIGAVVLVVSGYVLGRRDGIAMMSGRGPRRWWQ